MEETEEEEVSKNKKSVQVKQTQETFEAAGVRTTRIVRTTVRTTSSVSDISSSNVSTANLTKRYATSLDESSSLGKVSGTYEPTYEPRSISATPLNKSPKPSPDRNLRGEITIQELGKGGADKKVYRTTALLDLGKSLQRQPSVLKSDSIREENDSNVIITEPEDNKEGSLDKSEDSYPNSEELTKSSQEDLLPKGLLVAEERNISHSAFQALSRSHGSLDETKLNITEQKSLENLTVGGRRQVLKGGIVEEESTEVSGTRGMLLRSNTGQENRQQWLTADTGAANVNSRSMESLREHRASFITRSEKDVRGVVSASVEARSLESLEKEIRMMSNRYRRTVSGEEVSSDCNSPAEKKRGLFASGRAVVPSHLSLMPPEFCNRRLTILSPHSPMIQNLPTPGGSYNTSEMWQFTTQTLKTRRKKAVVLPRLVLPGSTEEFFTG